MIHPKSESLIRHMFHGCFLPVGGLHLILLRVSFDEEAFLILRKANFSVFLFLKKCIHCWLFLFLKKFIHCWLLWVFIGLHRLSLLVASGACSSLQCPGFSDGGPWA